MADRRSIMTRNAPRVVLSGGGTAGHVAPALAVAAELAKLRPDVELLYVGTADGIEADLVASEHPVRGGQGYRVVRSAQPAGAAIHGARRFGDGGLLDDSAPVPARGSPGHRQATWPVQSWQAPGCSECLPPSTSRTCGRASRIGCSAGSFARFMSPSRRAQGTFRSREGWSSPATPCGRQSWPRPEPLGRRPSVWIRASPPCSS
ncbi:MAG: glycosyltransferase [Anaerotruncus sp.]|nr:glycosyltransferase [Anaerotruncus sp.]